MGLALRQASFRSCFRSRFAALYLAARARTLSALASRHFARASSLVFGSSIVSPLVALAARKVLRLAQVVRPERAVKS